MADQDIYAQIAVKIISGQEAIIGPVAIEQAQKVAGITVDWNAKQVALSGDKVKVIESLIDQYKELFGQISVEVSRQAAAPLMSQLPANALPKTLS